MSLIKNITESGTPYADTPQERRTVILSNYLALTLSAAIFLVFVAFPQNKDARGILEVFIGICIFLFPVFLNRQSFINLSRFYLCLMPPVFVTWLMIAGMKQVDAIPPSTYDGLRIYLLATSCIPYLLLGKRNLWMLVMGILPSFLTLLFCDTILDFADVGYSNKGIQVTGYELTSVRSFIAYVIIGGSSFSLRLIVDRADTLNQKLISELESKNQIIKHQAESEVSQLNQQLIANLEELTKREITLRKSQEIAKVGSWEFHQENDSMFWSEQMYHIFEVDRSFDVNSERANGLLFGESLNNIRKGLSDLLNQKVIDLTFQTTTPRGSTKWVRILGYPTINNNKVIGASGIVHDITYFKEAEDRITASERNYQSLFEQASDAIMIADITGNFVDVNSSACKMLGYERDELLQLNISNLISAEQLASTPIKFKELIEGEQVIIERAFVRKNKTKLLVETNAKKIDENRMMAIVRDISERQQTAQKLLKYNRELALLNSITVTSAQASEIPGLLNRICEILVDEGGYKLAWIGEVPSAFESQTIQPQISKGDAIEYAQDLVIDFQNPNHQNGPVCQALLTNKAIVTNQILNDPHHEEWSFKATRHGLHSSVGICINADPTRYILNVYSGSPDSFDINEVSILERIVTSVESAIKSINAFNERDLAKRELQRAYERLSYHITNTPLAVIERDKDLKVTFWNKRAEELFGWKADEMIGKKPHEFLAHPDDTIEMINFREEIRNDKLFARSKERRNISKDGRELNCIWYYSMLKDDEGNLETFLSFVSDITEQKAANNQLNKRVNELTTLYRVSQLLSKEYETMERVLEKIVMILPRGWLHPDICEARIQIFNKHYKTRNYKDSAIMLEVPLTIHNELAGSIAVVYLDDTSIDVESPFVIEERNLINVIAEMLQIYLERKQEKDALVKAQANLRATINNTEIMIWSLDREFKLLTFNDPFERYNKEHFNLQIEMGSSHRAFMSDLTAKKWEDRYWRVLAGEIFEFEEKNQGIDFKYALSPIIENNQITGISIFADNVTQRNARERELVEANKKIEGLKIMALRAAMNPHFIFNVLSSIQYFITRNDQLNALNYLTSFSKLMRMALTRSVADSISLGEEIEMLENYVSLEKLRFEDKFDFHIEYKKSLDADNIRLPSLLIQPYVENAILHGLNNKIGRGKLVIRINTDEEYLVFEIEDDGIGRDAALQLKNSSQQTQKSMGTKLTEERLKLINADSEVAVTFKDLVKGTEAAGTLVQIRIKLY